MTSRYQTIFFVLVLLVLGSGIFALATPFGIGIQPDTRGYFEVAENLAEGQGLVFDNGQPLKRWAPLYSIVLALLVALGVPVAGAAWGLNLALFLLGGLVFARLIQRYVWTHGSRVVFGLSFLAYLLTMDMLERYTIALSEAFFVTMCMVGVYFCLRYVSRPGTKPLLLFTTLFILALTSRFIGLFLLAPGLFAILFLAQQPTAQKIKHSLIFGFTFLAPALVWYMRGKLLQGPVLPYTITAVPPPTPDLGLQAVQNTSSWFLTRTIPTSLRAILAVLLIAILAATLLWKWHRSGRTLTLTLLQQQFALFATAFLVTYAGTITVTMIFISVGVTPTSRYLMPMIPFALALLILALVLLFDLQTLPWRWSASQAGLAIIILLLFAQGVERVWQQNQNGVGHFTRAWLESELVAFVETLPQDTVFYSNEENHFAVVTEIPMLEMPQLEKYGRQIPQERYNERIAFMLNDLMANDGGYLVIYTDVSARQYQALNLEYIQALPELALLQAFDDGFVLVAR